LKTNILVRTDGSLKIGLGHLVRCTALAQMLKDDFKITFFCKDIPETMVDELQSNNFGFIKIKEEPEFLRLLTNDIIVVLDGYNFNTDYQKKIKNTGAKLVCIDDLHNNEFMADLIINHTPGITPKNYKSQFYTQFALGLDYTMLRPVFLEQAKKQRKIEKIETVMICFGGSDLKNLTQPTLKVALKFPQFKKIIVITGAAFQENEILQQLVKSDARIEHRKSLNEMQMLETMLVSDLVIVPASGILLETICCGCIPLICFYAENQKEFHFYISNTFCINSFGDNSNIFQFENLYSQLRSIKLNSNKALPKLRKRMSGSLVNHLKLFHSLSK
jgi:UDP-2,4-diacetamido-2,4,6-trideoxy-beta-L-altropyranose hydrolase